MLAGGLIWWRAEGGVIRPVEVAAFDAKRVTRMVDGKKIQSRRSGRGVFYCPEWEEARQCLLAWNQRKMDDLRLIIDKRNMHVLRSLPDSQRDQAKKTLALLIRHQRWLEGLKPPAMPMGEAKS